MLHSALRGSGQRDRDSLVSIEQFLGSSVRTRIQFGPHQGEHLRKLGSVIAVAGVLVLGALISTRVHAADHLDSDSLAGNPMADINDVYSWMSGTKLNLAMTVSPADVGTLAFGPSVQYAFHLTSKAALTDLGTASGTTSSVICTFASNTSARCWVVNANGVAVDYVTGDPSATAGLASADGKLMVFAGRRSDPFFFNLSGFRAMIAAYQSFVVQTDVSGCPLEASLGADKTVTLRNDLKAANYPAAAPCPANTADCFAALNVMAIVVQVDASLVNSGTNTFLAVWGSTHQGS